MKLNQYSFRLGRLQAQGLFYLMLSSALLLVPLRAPAMSSTTQVAWPGRPVKAQPDWPDGILELLNDPLRAEGWNPWFSEWPSDVNHYTFKVQNTTEVNDLITKLAAIKAPKLQLRLNPAKEPTSLGFTTRLKNGNNHAVVFAMGNQTTLSNWYQRLPEIEPGMRKFGVHRYREMPTALPPTLTLYAGNPAIDLNELRVPENIATSADVSEASREKMKDDPLLQAIDEFIAGHQLKQKNTTQPRMDTNKHQ